jgi:hypothetical protein
LGGLLAGPGGARAVVCVGGEGYSCAPGKGVQDCQLVTALEVEVHVLQAWQQGRVADGADGDDRCGCCRAGMPAVIE